MQNQITKMNTQQFQITMVNEVEKSLNDVGQKLTEYQKTCVINAMAAVVITCKSNDIPLQDIDQIALKIAIKNIGLSELNFNAIPSEAYIDLRKGDNGKYSIAIKPQGAGNEKLVRRFGVNVKDMKPCLLIREGDEYTLPGFDGEKMTPFTWKPKSLDAKVIMVVYPVLKTDGTYEYLMATRESTKANIVAQVRQNTLYVFKKEYIGKDGKKHETVDKGKREEFYAQLNALAEKDTFEEFLNESDVIKYINPTYTSGGSKEAMILRKMKNNALKYYPKEYDNTYVAEAVKDMFEEKDESLNEKPSTIVDVDAVEKVEKEIDEPVSNEAPKDFGVNDDGELLESQPEIVEEEIAEELPPHRDTYEEEL